ncbi:MetQ/NlpA family ABC transporter substrate-binding protein [Collinsella sp. An307]|uniref:MetQ/NlpA family ABC transporter substrate-binding protein n=1 Tax=Collinsella sp. An307 TaxID=1965630 RepID=UPI000B3997AA|nr:MetQ/NlpA family ABC transporter substrate-binding protein [Collinsella sp. An307]OUO20752.1 metal ABC transporter substrate-binding protein [Collinsella sp. An307]
MQNFTFTRRSLFASAAVLAVSSLAGCGSKPKHEHGTLKIGASPSPHAEILNDFVAPRLEEQGITLEVKEYTDYIKPNQDVTSGDLDANYFQHINYLNNYNAENGTDLVNAGKIHFEPMGVFAGRSNDLAAITDGATISIPNDPTNEGRALLLLQEQGVITLSDDAGLEATPNDIVDNPHNIQFSEQEAAMLPSTLADVDFAVINGNYAIDAGLTLADAVAQERADSEIIAEEYANVICTRPELEDDECIVALVEVLQTEDFKAYLEETFGDSVQAAF